MIVFQCVCRAVTLGQHSSSSPDEWSIAGGDGMQAEGSVLLGPPQKKLFTEKKKKIACAAFNTSTALFLLIIVSVFHPRVLPALYRLFREAR